MTINPNIYAPHKNFQTNISSKTSIPSCSLTILSERVIKIEPFFINFQILDLNYLMMERMDELNKQIFQDHHQHDHKSWGFTANNSYQDFIEETSTVSNGSSSVSSCSSFDTADETLSSSSSSSLSSSSLDLSDLMIQLPIKRGLSKFYQGKSESFTSLARVMSIEDLPKKIKNPYNKMRKMKGNSNSKSHGGGLDSYKSHTLPRPIISKNLSPFLRLRSFARPTKQEAS